MGDQFLPKERQFLSMSHLYKFTRHEESSRPNLPTSYFWSIEEVAEWISDLGYPQYRACFVDNEINGKKLILIDASKLPKIGIQDFAHIKFIAAAIRIATSQSEQNYRRSIADPYVDPSHELWLRKSRSGPNAEACTVKDIFQEINKKGHHTISVGKK